MEYQLNKNSLYKNRIWEVDFLRGIALILMIYFHIVYDLDELFGFNVDCDSMLNFLSGRVAAVLFMFLAGVSSNLSKSNLKRGLKTLGIAMVMTTVTHLAERFLGFGGLGIKFGILHFLGAAMMISVLFQRMPTFLILVFAIASAGLGAYFDKLVLPYRFLFPLGIIYPGFTSGDYYPMFPWLSIFFGGLFAGRLLYKEKKSLFNFTINSNPVSFIGRHTLFIYVLHQPVILAIIYLISMFC